MIKLLKKIYKGCLNGYFLYCLQRNEKRKINDSRRQKILSNYNLSENQKKEIDSFFEKNYGQKVPYDWHRYFASYTGNFDVKFIPELIYIPVIEKKFNDKKFIPAFSDKNLLPLLIGDINNVRTPRIYLSCIKGIFRDENMEFISREQALHILENLTCFGKPTVDSNSGKMCDVYKFENGVDTISGRKAEEVLDSMGYNFCFQELIENCESVSKLHKNSLNTFRITTYLWKGKVWHFPVIMRIGQGESVLDNAHKGGMFIGLSDDGTLNECAFTEFQNRYYKHPDSGIEFNGYKIPELKLALAAVEKVHQRIPQIGMISWDAVVNESGKTVIIEMNVQDQSVWLPQMAHGKGAFGENTADVLSWVKK